MFVARKEQRTQGQRQRFLWHDSSQWKWRGSQSSTQSKLQTARSWDHFNECPALAHARLSHSDVEYKDFSVQTIQDLSNRVCEPKSGSSANVRNYLQCRFGQDFPDLCVCMSVRWDAFMCSPSNVSVHPPVDWFCAHAKCAPIRCLSFRQRQSALFFAQCSRLRITKRKISTAIRMGSRVS